jgi:hypothetical protein
MPPPKQKPIAATFLPGTRRRQLRHARLHVGVEARRVDLREDRRDLRLVADLRRAALLGQQVDREGRPAVRGHPAGDVADVVGEAAVLVDDEHGAAGALRRRPRALEGAARAVEGDRLRVDDRPALDGAVGPGRTRRARMAPARRARAPPGLQAGIVSSR